MNDIRIVPEAQHHARWTPPGGVLGELVTVAERRTEALVRSRATLEAAAATAPCPPSFLDALRGRPDVAVIAEVKRASPSSGSINPGMDAARQARAYEEGGAAAVSVLTEETRFGGTLRDLESASSAVAIPVLRKDFIVSEEQLLEARAAGAAAALLIVRALPGTRLRELVQFAIELGVEPLVEVHVQDEIGSAVRAGARVIGINSRNLESLTVTASTFERLIDLIPGVTVTVAESGIRSRADVEQFAALGAHAVLVGSVLSAAPDPAAAVRNLTRVPRVRD